MDQALPPTRVRVGETPPDVIVRLRVVDAVTGVAVERVIEADACAGLVRRHAVENGNLVRSGDGFVIVEEHRATRIEWIDAAPTIVEPAAVSSGEAPVC